MFNLVKKSIVISAIVLAMQTAFAQECPAPYVGIGTGVTVNTSSGNLGNYRGMPLNLIAGYGGAIDNLYYLAGEVDFTPGTAELNSNGSLRSTYAYNVSILPGLMMSDHTFAFGRFGLDRTEFSNLNTLKNGVMLGLGLQTGIMQNIDIRGEYDYISFGSISRTNASGTPRTDAVNLALIYKFN